MTATQAIEYIHSVSWKGSIPGLGRTRELLRRMGNPEKELKFIHIVGTNGKGSTAAMLASVLQRAGYRAGLYTSPFLYRFQERMQVDGREIGDDELGEITAWVKPLAETMDEHPTEFELVTAIAMEYFKRQGTDIVVLEAGMGGALDSTNVIPAPEAAVICNIGLDHTEYLGDTIEKIAATKAEIVKPGCTCVLYRSTDSVEAVVRRKCEQVGVALRLAPFDAIVPVSHSLEGQTFDLGARKQLKIPLLGEHQMKNTAVVLETLDALREKGWSIPEDAIREGLAATRWPGRFEILRRDPLFIVDGGHNPQCMAALTKNIRDYLAGTDLTILTGVLADKDRTTMYPPLVPYASRFVTVTPASPRAMTAADLGTYLAQFGKEVIPCEDVPTGVRQAVEAARAHGGAVLTCGSLYMIGDVVAALRQLK